MAYLYRHIRLDKNEPFYIGIGSDVDYVRASSKKNRNIYWERIVNRVEYRIEIILDDLTWEQSCEKEIEFIALYGRADLKKGTLCNLTDGGEGAFGLVVSKETRSRRSESYKGRFVGEKNPFYGKKHSEETKRKISEAKTGIPSPTKGLIFSQERKDEMSKLKKGNKNMLGKKHSLESRKKMSEKAKGRVGWNKGIPRTEEEKLNLSKKMKGRTAWNKGKVGIYSNETIEKIKTSLRKYNTENRIN